MKTILIDAVDCFISKDGKVFQEMCDLLETYPNNKIILTGANDEQFEKFRLNKMPYEVFTLKHNPEKTDPQYYEKMLSHFNLTKDEVIYFEHNLDAVKSAQSVGIETYFYDNDKKDINELKKFFDTSLSLTVPKEILYATTNEAKLKAMQLVLGSEYKIVNLKDVGIESQAEENGIDPIENALKKARYCYQKTGKPSLSIDFGFFIDGLPAEEQPGPSVKRIIPISKEREPSDEEVLEFYKNIITKLGGKANAYWLRALAYVSQDGEFAEETKIPKMLVAIPSNKRVRGFPMTSLQIDPHTGKYECELTDEELLVSRKKEDDVVRLFIQHHTKPLGI